MKALSVTLLGLLIIMLDGYDLQCIGFVAPEMAKSWSLTLAAFAPAFSAGLLGTIPGALLAGPGRRRLGQRSMLAMAITVFGAGTLATAWVPSLTTLIALRFVVGIGLGTALPLVMTLVAENAPTHFRATSVTLALCGQPTGAILGAALCARLIPRYGWGAAFIMGGLLPLILLPAVFARVRSRDLVAVADTTDAHSSTVSPQTAPQSVFETRLLSTTLLLWATAFGSVFLNYVVVNWLPGVVRGQGHSLQASLLAISLFNVGGIIGGLSISAIADRRGPFKVVPLAYAIAALCLVSLTLTAGSLRGFQLGALLSGLTGAGASMCLGSMAVLLYPSALRTNGVGWTLSVGRAGAALSPLLVGAALTSGMVPSRLFFFAAAAATLAAASFYTLGKIRKGPLEHD